MQTLYELRIPCVKYEGLTSNKVAHSVACIEVNGELKQITLQLTDGLLVPAIPVYINDPNETSEVIHNKLQQLKELYELEKNK